MTKKINMTGKERRAYIVKELSVSEQPITGNRLAEKTGVSRQVIVQDVSLLKAKNNPIIATNRGYLLMKEVKEEGMEKRVIVCKHSINQAEEELNLIVDHGVSVQDVIVEHPVYGDLTGSLMISSRLEVRQFINKIVEKKASLLSELTNGVHLHTLKADSIEKLDAACRALSDAGILIESD